MPYDLRTTTLAIAVCPLGVRCYTKTAAGDVREGCLDLDDSSLAAAVQSKNGDVLRQAKNWYPGELSFTTAPDSTLCAILWGTWQLAVFYQDTNGAILQKSHGLSGWRDGVPVQAGCMQGSSIAEVHSADASMVMVFYQDRDGMVYGRRGHNGLTSWDAPIPIAKGAKCTGITATSWNDVDLRVYFQDESLVMREWMGTVGGTQWSLGEFVLQYNSTVCATSAISWQSTGPPDVHVYIQEPSSDIIEWVTSGGRGWQRGDFTAKALQNSDLQAFARHPSGKHVVNMMWAGSDQLLHQRVNDGLTGWLTEDLIAYLQDAGNFVGSWNDAQFSDNTIINIDDKKIKKVRVRSGEWVDGFALDYTDGTSTPWPGGNGGVAQEFALADGEDITQILVRTDGRYILRLQFFTSLGNKSIAFGTTGNNPILWEMDGRPLIGFIGSAGAYIDGLMPFWAPRRSPASSKDLADMSQKAKTIGDDAATARAHCAALATESAAIHTGLEADLKQPADSALQGIHVLIASVQEYEAADKVSKIADNTLELLRKCKGQSAVVHTRFDELYNQAHALLDRSNKLSTALTLEAAQAETRLQDLKDMETLAGAIRVQTENRAAIYQDRVQAQEQAVKTAESTLEEAKKNKKSAETGRILRDIFTFGLGEIGDWGGLQDQINYANKLIESTQRDLATAQQAAADTQAALTAVTTELSGFTQLAGTIEADRSASQATLTSASAMLKANGELVSESLDVSLYLGALASKSGTLPVQYSVRGFAAALESIATLTKTPVGVPQILQESPESLQASLEEIASSNEPPADPASLGL